MKAFINDHRTAYGVEPTCKVLPAKSPSDLREIAPSTYHSHAARRSDAAKIPAWLKRDAVLEADIRRVFEANFGVYGVRKVQSRASGETPLSRSRQGKPGGDGGEDDPAAQDGPTVQRGGGL